MIGAERLIVHFRFNAIVKVTTAAAAAVITTRRIVTMFLVAWALKTTSSTQIGTVFEHIIRLGIQRPERPLAWLLVVTGDFDETVVQRQIVTYAVLPALFVLAVVRETIHDEVADAV